jgi:hypothetical protein
MGTNEGGEKGGVGGEEERRRGGVKSPNGAVPI